MFSKKEGTNWRKITEFPGYYISDTGLASHNGILLTPHIYNKYGHSQIRMYKNGKQYARDLHRLVAEAFVPNPNNLPLVRHLDGNPRNNLADNLAWGTYSDNARDSIEMGTFVFNYHHFTQEELGKSIETNRTPIKAINVETGEESTYYSQADAARKLGLSQGNIGRVLIGQRNKTGGYYFEYMEKGGVLDAHY